MTKAPATTVEKAVAKFLRALQERNASPHTIKAYTADLASFAEYIGPHGWGDIDHVLIRGYLSNLYERGLSKTSVARSLAALRSLYKWLAQEGVVEQNPAALVATPKLPKSSRACRRSKKSATCSMPACRRSQPFPSAIRSSWNCSMAAAFATPS